MKKKKIGRPTESIKDTMVRVRMDEAMINKLDECVKKFDSNRSEVIREGIEKIYNSIKENKES